MPRDASETERLALAACESLAQAQQRMPTVKMVMDAIGVQSPEVVGRALRKWRETVLERTLAQDVGIGLPSALVQPLKSLIALAQAQAQGEIEQERARLAEAAQAKDQEVVAAQEAAARAEAGAEQARHELAVYGARAEQEAKGLRAERAALTARIEAGSVACEAAQRALGAERENAARFAARLEQTLEHHAAEKLALVGQYEDRLESVAGTHEAERTQLTRQVERRADEAKRLYDEIVLEREKTTQVRQALAKLQGAHETLSSANEGLRRDLAEAQAARIRAEEAGAAARAQVKLLEASGAQTAAALAELRAQYDRCARDLAQVRAEIPKAKRLKTKRAGQAS